MNKSSKMSHKPEVLVPAKEAAKYPQASFPRSELSSVAESCSIYKNWKKKVKEHFITLNGNEKEKVLRASKWSNKNKIKWKKLPLIWPFSSILG